MAEVFDAIVIGAGQAGPSLAVRLAGAGWKVAMVERKLFGGTCVNAGCTPTKTMIASAHTAQSIRRAKEYGVLAKDDFTVDMALVKSRKDDIVAKSRNGVEGWLRGTKGCTVLQGAARFQSATEVVVADKVLRAEHVFLNVGARPTRPTFPGVDKVPHLTSTTILDLDTLPEHLIVVGGSYIGLEFAQMFRRFGSKVTIVERGQRLVQHEDEDVSTAVREILEKEGISVRLNAECIHLENRSSGVAVGLNCHEGVPEVEGSHILLAVGRTPNTDDLGLENAGIVPDEHGYIEVDDQLRTKAPGIWALGDCNGKGGFTHTSYNDYEIVAANLLDNDPRKVSDRIPVHALFIDPPLAQVGLTEAQVRDQGRPALVGIRTMTRVGRAVEMGESQGFMKVLVDAESREILGATILGTRGDEAIHCILTAMYARKPASLLQRSMHIHPTVAELIPTVFGELKPLE